MLSDHPIPGEIRQYEEPDWEPLRALVGMDLADWFMWMYEVELDDGTAVHAYKHIATRRYFHLSTDGRAFAYCPRGRYQEIAPRHAIDIAFERWRELLLPEEDPAPLRAALRRARRAATARAGRAGRPGRGAREGGSTDLDRPAA